MHLSIDSTRHVKMKKKKKIRSYKRDVERDFFLMKFGQLKVQVLLYPSTCNKYTFSFPLTITHTSRLYARARSGIVLQLNTLTVNDVMIQPRPKTEVFFPKKKATKVSADLNHH